MGAARTLARAGVPVRGFDYDARREGFLSRKIPSALCPDPSERPEAFLAFLVDAAGSESSPPFLLPCNDKFARFVSDHRERLEEHFIFVLPPAGVFDALVNKEGTYDLASRAGIATPRTATLALPSGAPPQRAQIERDLPDGFPFPALVKPSLSFTFWGLTSEKVLLLRDRSETLDVLARLPRGAAYVLQEIIPGDETNLIFYSTYRDRSGRPLAEFVSRKIRQRPPGFGTSTLFESCLNPDALETGRRLFDSLGYRGLGSAEFKRDPRDGRLKLIEVNARLWLFHLLSVACGVNFPLTAYRDAANLPALPQSQSPEVVKWYLLFRDILTGLFYWRDGRLTLRQWLASYRGRRVEALWDRHDPLPFLAGPFSRFRRRPSTAVPGSPGSSTGSAPGPSPARTPRPFSTLDWSEAMETLYPRPRRGRGARH